MRIAIAKSRYENPVGFFRGAVLLATSSSQLALTKVGISDPSKINNHLQETTIIIDLLSEKNEETRLTRKNKISQLFAMRIAIAKSRYENPLGFFRGTQAISPSAHSSPGQDSGFPVPSDSVESPGRTRTNGHGPIVRMSDGHAEIQLARSSYEGLQEEYFQHAPNSEESLGGTSDGLDVPVEHPHELHPCAHSCCQRTGINMFGCCVVWRLWSWWSGGGAPVFAAGVGGASLGAGSESSSGKHGSRQHLSPEVAQL